MPLPITNYQSSDLLLLTGLGMNWNLPKVERDHASAVRDLLSTLCIVHFQRWTFLVLIQQITLISFFYPRCTYLWDTFLVGSISICRECVPLLSGSAKRKENTCSLQTDVVLLLILLQSESPICFLEQSLASLFYARVTSVVCYNLSSNNTIGPH